jgi:coatomer subunit alpha
MQVIEVRDLANAVVKTVKPPVPTNEIFYGGTASLILSSANSVVLYDIQQQTTVAEISTPAVKYAVWSADGSLVALMSKHSKYSTNVLRVVSDMYHSYYYLEPELL